MHRKIRRLWGCSVLALSVLALLAVPETASAQGKVRNVEQPSRLTVIRPAPPEVCGLLNNPHTRQLMDGLLFNLIWSCGRQNELGKLATGSGYEEEEDTFRLLTAAATSTDSRVNNPAGESGAAVTQSETSLAHNPVTGTVCSAFNDSGEFYGGGGGFTGFARSLDGGRTWQDNGAVGGISMGDPSLVWRRADGYFYLGTLESGGGLAIWISTDDCQTFRHLATPTTGGDDKEILAVDNNPASPNYGNIYMVWTDFGLGGAPIRAMRSADGGVTWSAPVTLSSGGTVQGAWPAVAPNGDVYVAWLQYASWPSGNITVQVSRSTNGGLSYTPVTSPLSNAVSPRDSAASSSCGRPALRGNLRYLASPQIAVDSSGVLHVVYSFDPDGFNTGDVVNVYYRRSTNSGASWSTQVRLNDDTTTRDQFFPTIQVQGSTVMAAWYDRRNDSNNLQVDYYKRISNDGGLTWLPSERVSDVSSSIVLNPNLAACYHGDYDQSLVLPSKVEVVQWADDRAGNPDIYADAASNNSACTINLSTGTSDCSGALSYSGGVAQINLAGGYVRLDALVDVCNPSGMVAHIADSPTSDGYGGDGFTTVHNAEVQLVGTDLMFFGTDDTSLDITDPITLEKNTVAATGCYRVHFSVMEDQVLFDNDGVTTDPPRVRLDSYR
ncbi:MAG: sialidase family protein, partial [Thermoanaerobaculia bacterium]